MAQMIGTTTESQEGLRGFGGNFRTFHWIANWLAGGREGGAVHGGLDELVPAETGPVLPCLGIPDDGRLGVAQFLGHVVVSGGVFGDVDGRVGDALRIEVVAASDIVKASDEDLSWLYPDRTPNETLEAWLELGPANPGRRRVRLQVLFDHEPPLVFGLMGHQVRLQIQA